MPDWAPVDESLDSPEIQTLTEELHNERMMREIVRESYADLEAMYLEDVGWQRLGQEESRFSPQGRKRVSAVADLATSGNALIKRGVNLRIAYVWGQGITVAVQDDGATGQDVNAVIDQLWADKSNRREFTSSEAQARYERQLATHGEAFFALPTDEKTGRVRIRKIPPEEIVDRVTDPEDAANVWFYKRVWVARKMDPVSGQISTENRTTFYPALGYFPVSRPERWAGAEVRWDVPMRMVGVNQPTHDWRGQGDVLAALPWSKMDKEFLEDLAVYMRALTRILGQVQAKGGKARAAASAAMSAPPPVGPAGLPPLDGSAPVAGWAVTDPNTSVSLVSKAGAQIDADSSKPFATRVASALEVPLTMLLGDPGVTGARATAETLDQPTELMAKLRREVHTELIRDICGYAIDMAVVAGGGPLTGQVGRDGDELTVELPEDDERTINVDWPDFDSTPVKDKVTSITTAAAAETPGGAPILPPAVTFRLLATVLGVDDVDELVKKLTDAEGNWIEPAVTAADTAVRLQQQGLDPAAAL